MPITETQNAFVDPTAVSIGLAQMFAVVPGSGNPACLVLSVLDRNEYTAAANRTTGTLTGNGHTVTVSSIGGDGRGAGIVFTYQAFTGRYYNALLGYLDQLTYNSSGSAGDVTSLSLFGAGSLTLANQYAGNPYTLMQMDAAGYLGSATVVTQPNFTAGVPAQATPNSIAAIADSFVGQAWNMNGCWVLASTIAAEAGAALPVQSTMIGLPGKANGEWIVAFNGPAGQAGNWQAMVTAGEMVVIGTPGGGGHITTCVAGFGSSAMLVDNITYLTSGGQIANAAHDGSSSDVIIAAPHAATQEWAGVQAASVVIYQLDAPIVSRMVASDALACLATQSLASLFAATDPANRAITAWQVYDTAGSDQLSLNGVLASDHSAGSALTALSLGAVGLVAGATPTTDTLEVRACNGTYWGDWQSLSVAIVAVAPTPPVPPVPPAPPVLAAQTPNQTWTSLQPVALTLPAATFSDPRGEALHYSATLSNGQALPTWLSFNPATETFSGIAPPAAQSLSIRVTATDSSGLSASDTFSARVLAPPLLTAPTASQIWTEGKAISLALPANTFTDPQGETLTYTATLSNGQALPAWLAFNPLTETFTGTAPASVQSLSLKVTATDSSGLAASEVFAASVQASPPVIRPGISVSAPVPSQVWTDGTSVILALPANTFTDSRGLKMTFAAYEVSGPNVTSWLHFNPATDTLSGNVPAAASGTVGLAVIARDALGMTAVDLFSVTFAPGAQPGSLPAAHAVGSLPVIDVSRAMAVLALPN